MKTERTKNAFRSDQDGPRLPAGKADISDSLTIRSFAKINLALDVLARLENGYHSVRMIMQMIDLFDTVSVAWMPAAEKDAGAAAGQIRLSVAGDDSVPADERNLAWKAAQLMFLACPAQARKGTVEIHIEKRIPAAAGLAGGSGNSAAVLLALSRLWRMDFSLRQLMELGVRLGADVPFCLTGLAALNPQAGYAEDPAAAVAALAEGVGEILTPVPPLAGWVLLSRPPVPVSTVAVYQKFDPEMIKRRPDIDAIVEALKRRNHLTVAKNMVNVLENVSLKEYPLIMYTKNNLMRNSCADGVLMSGSGPTVFAVFQNRAQGLKTFQQIDLPENENYFVQLLTGGRRRWERE